jgi:hypothetical protein
VNQISAIARARIEAQGFVGLDDQTLAQIDNWLRLSPAICMLWAAVGTALSSPTVLWSLVPFAALGGLSGQVTLSMYCTTTGSGT